MPFAEVNDIDLHYKLDGEGDETIVLINGLADDLESWFAQMDDFLSAGYRVLRIDNRGIGASSKPAGPYSSRLLADDAKALVDLLGVTDFHLMGVSMGGMIAQEYALAYSGDLRSVTFGCTYAAPGPFCSRMFAMWEDMAPVPVHAYLAQLAVIQNHDTTDRLNQITTVPSLVLAGEEDILIPVALSRRIHEAIPGSQWATTKGGHACLWEHPAEFNKTFLDFIRRHGRG